MREAKIEEQFDYTPGEVTPLSDDFQANNSAIGKETFYSCILNIK